MAEVACRVLGGDGVECGAESLMQRLGGARGNTAQLGFQLGPGGLDGAQVRRVRVCTRINPLLQLGFRRRAVEVIAIQICAASQRGSRYWRKTSARYGEAGPKRALCVEVGTKGQVISRTDS